MISAGDLAAMQVVLAGSLPDTCTVKRNTPASDGQGGSTESWSTVATVACRISPGGLSPQEQVMAARITSALVWVITLPQGTDVTAKDRITAGTRTFEVASPLAPRSWELARRVMSTEVK